MQVPDYQSLMLPILELALSGETSMRDAQGRLAKALRLDDAALAEMMPGSSQTKFYNRTAWAITYLVKASLLTRTGRGRFAITHRGREALATKPTKIDNEFLAQFPEFNEFKKRPASAKAATPPPPALPTGTPEDRIAEAAQELDEQLAFDLLAAVLAATPLFFEHLVLDLMLKMGYGKAGGGRHVGRSADGGIDGVVTEDALGLSLILLQAKRYAPDNGIGVEKIREFAGTLDERGATKGVFVTTSYFAQPAIQYAERSHKRLALIDGVELARLMIQYGLGVRTTQTVEIRKVDRDYFSPEE